MPTIGSTPRPAYVYDAETDTWIPVAGTIGPMPTDYVSINGGSTIAVSSGTIVPLTITNNGTGDSFIINDVTGDTTQFIVDADGNIGIGSAPITTPFKTNLVLSKDITGSTSVYSILNSGTIKSDVTSGMIGYFSSVGTEATTFTVGSISHFAAAQGTKGAGSTITTQAGFVASSNMTGATTNYGFLSQLSSGTGRWNYYASGTASNYFRGSVFIGNSTTAGQNTDGLTINGNDIELMTIMGAWI